MSLVVRNRLSELSRTIGSLTDEGRVQQVAKDSAERAGPQLLSLLRREAPSGTRWTEPPYRTRSGSVINHGRPSMRLGLGTLENQWGAPEILEVPDGARINIYSMALQMRFLLSGVKRHPVTGKPWISFWSFRDGKPRLNVDKFGRPYTISHPGFPVQDLFIDKAMSPRGENILLSNFRQIQRTVLDPLRRFLG